MAHPHVHVPYDLIGNHLDFIKLHRVNLEIFFSADVLDTLKQSDVRYLSEQLDYDPSLTIHAPFMDLSPGAVDPRVRTITVERFSQIFDIASVLKPKVIVFHSGYEKWKYALKADLWLENSLLTWKELLKRTAGLEVKIAIENVFEDTPENLRLLMEAVQSDHFGICFDSGHFNLFSKVSLGEWLNQLKPYILELHLHDNRGSADDHLAMGEGSFDFGTLFSILNDCKPIYTIEAHSKEGVLKSIERLNQLLSVRSR
ncbi:MAG: sugar phosphate isomerase/epimerase family protein [Nitrospirota bacterium]